MFLRRSFFHPLIGIIVLHVLITPVRADEPLCGIQSVYTGALLLGLKPHFSDILHSEFVASEKGSSLAEMEKAAATLGLHSLSVAGLSAADLRWFTLPVILHVKTDLASSNYNHFVLFAGMRDGKAIIFDGTNDPMEWTLGEVATRWDGNALVLSREPIELSSLTGASRWRLASWALGVSGVIALAMVAQKRGQPDQRGWLSTSFRQGTALIVVAACAALVFHATSAQGFIVGREGVRTIWGAHASSFLPRIDAQTARELSDTGAAIFVDARSPDDHIAGHIPGSISMPAYIPESEAIRIAKQMPRDTRLVVYCSNALCPFSYATAQRLLQAGHEDVVIFTGGWKEWQAHNGAERS